MTLCQLYDNEAMNTSILHMISLGFTPLIII